MLMLTTIDNPYNPFTHFDEWFEYDRQAGYNTPSYLAAIAITSDEMSDVDQEQEIDRAITEIVELNVLGIYRKVASPTEATAVESGTGQR